ncbi:MAG: hypothetical protein AAF989_14265, partial [Planctomycetota bacterium]
VVDARDEQPRDSSDELIQELMTDRDHDTCLTVINKVDLCTSRQVKLDIQTTVEAVTTSVVTGLGISELTDAIVRKLIPHPPLQDEPLVLNKRQLTIITELLSASNDATRHRGLTRLLD